MFVIKFMVEAAHGVTEMFAVVFMSNEISLALIRHRFSHIVDVVCGLGTSCEISLGLTRVR